jgi:hypothetical protein
MTMLPDECTSTDCEMSRSHWTSRALTAEVALVSERERANAAEASATALREALQFAVDAIAHALDALIALGAP